MSRDYEGALEWMQRTRDAIDKAWNTTDEKQRTAAFCQAQNISETMMNMFGCTIIEALTRCQKWDEAGMVVVPRELSVKENARFYMLMESVGISTFCDADSFWQKLLGAAAPITSAGE